MGNKTIETACFCSLKSPASACVSGSHGEYNTCLFEHKGERRCSDGRLCQTYITSCLLHADTYLKAHNSPCPPFCPLCGGDDGKQLLHGEHFLKRKTWHAEPHGTHKIHYHASSDWDFILETQKEIDMSLVIPHYRARRQPVDYRLKMFVAATSAPVKLKVCRPVPRCKFYLEVRADVSNVTVWLPSDFKGHIWYSGRASYSAGFVNRIMENVCRDEDTCDQWDADQVVIHTAGAVTFRMWDVHTNASENPRMEMLKRMFRYSKKPEGTRRGINWDFLLED